MTSPTWDEMRLRLQALPSMAGDENRPRRVEFMTRSLGYTERPENLWLAYDRATDEQRAHVDTLLCELERREMGLLS